MKKITREWVEKAEGDYLTAERESQAQPPNYDAAAFHAQQSAAKYLKARLVEANLTFPKTHDLAALLNLLLPIESSWGHLRPALETLSSTPAIRCQAGGTLRQADVDREQHRGPLTNQ